MNRRKWLAALALAGATSAGVMAGETRWRLPRFRRRGENFSVSLSNYTGEWVEGVRVAGIIEHAGQEGPWMLLIDYISPTISQPRKDLVHAAPIGNNTFTSDNASFIPERVEVSWHKRHPDTPKDILEAKRFWTDADYDNFYKNHELKGQKIGPIVIPVRARIPKNILEKAELPYEGGFRLVLLFALMDDRTVWFKWFLRKRAVRGGTNIIKAGGDW